MTMKQMHRRILEAVWPVSSASPAVSQHLPPKLQPHPMPMKEGRFCRIRKRDSRTLESKTPEASEEVSLVLVTEIQKEDELLSLPDFTLPLRTTPSDDDLEEIYQLAFGNQPSAPR